MADVVSPNLNPVETAEQLSERELDALPVGMIQLDREGRILRYNKTEGRIARLKPADAIGKDFFNEVAPCTRVQSFFGLFREGVERGELHTVFPFRFKFADGRQKDVQITIYYSRATDTVWLQVNRPESGKA